MTSRRIRVSYLQLDIPGLDTFLPSSLPRRGNGLTRFLGRLLLKLLGRVSVKHAGMLKTKGGWHIEGYLPNIPKLVVVGAPHTSQWDGVLAIAIFLASGLDCRWMAKKEAFQHPLGGVMRWLGGIPVDREAPQDLVQQMIDEMNRHEKCVLVITPEGTRKKVERWKTGFYRIALATGTPIALGYLDYARQVVGIGLVFEPTGQMEGQIEEMQAFFRTITPRHPERA